MNSGIRSIVLFVFILTCSHLSAAPASQEGMVQLKKGVLHKISQKWYFMPADSPAYARPGIEMKGWIFRSINDPSPWREFESLQSEGAIAWYRLDVKLDEIQDLSLLLSHHKRGAKIFLNGSLIHETRPFSPEGETPPIIGKPVLLHLPTCLLHRGMNCIAIRTGSLDGWGGFMNQLHIGPSVKMNKHWIMYIFRYIFLASISLFLSLFFMMHFFQRKSEIYYLHYSGICFGTSAWVLGFSGLGLYLFDYQFTFILFSYVGALSIGIFSILFIHSFFNIRRRLLSHIFVGFYLAHILALLGEYFLTGGIKFYNMYLYDIFIQSFLLNIIYILVINIRAVKNGYSYAKRILAGNIIYALVLIHSILVFLSIIYTQSFLLEGFFVMTIFFASALASRFAKVHSELEVAHGDLLVMDRMKDDFLAITSHELRTPLHGIMGVSELLLNGQNQVREVRNRERISIIMASAKRLNSLVGEILDFSKLRAEKVDLYLDRVELDSIILSVVSLMKGIAENKNIVLQTVIDKDIPPVTADKKRIEQVLINLVGNAVKYTDEGRILVTAASMGDHVLVTVKDTGMGIESEVLSRIWNPYEQGGDPDTSNSGGCGLGLPIAKYLVELHGGTIRAESRPGRGSIFYIELPMIPPEQQAGISRVQYAGPGGEVGDALKSDTMPSAFPAVPDSNIMNTGERILVVDDDPMNLLLLNSYLSEQGYRVITAGTGAEGLKLVDSQRPHLVILDLMLPGMSGYDVMKRIKDRHNNEFIPVIMVTARNQTEDMIKGFLYGCNDFLSKPFNLRELLMRVQNQLVMRNILGLERELSKNLAQEKEKLETSVVKRSRVLRDNVRKLSNWESVIVEDLKFSFTFLEKLMTQHVETKLIDYSINYDPLLKIGGDVYSIHECDEGRVRVFLADATGHGINASLNSITIMTEYNLIRDQDLTPGEMVSHLNNQFCSHLSDYGIIFTCCIAEIDIEKGIMVLASAGHPAQFCFSTDGIMHECIPRGPLIGLMEDLQYEEAQIEFPVGSTLVMYTDGLVDEFSGNRAHRDKERRTIRDEQYFRDALQRLHPMEDLDRMSSDIKIAMKGNYQKLREDDDDITLILLRRTG